MEWSVPDQQVNQLASMLQQRMLCYGILFVVGTYLGNAGKCVCNSFSSEVAAIVYKYKAWCYPNTYGC